MGRRHIGKAGTVSTGFQYRRSVSKSQEQKRLKILESESARQRNRQQLGHKKIQKKSKMCVEVKWVGS